MRKNKKHLLVENKEKFLKIKAEINSLKISDKPHLEIFINYN